MISTNHYKYAQKRIYAYNIHYLFDEINMVANKEYINQETFAEPSGHNYAQLVFQVASVQTNTAKITVIGSNDFSSKLVQTITIDASTPINTNVALPIYLNKITSIKSDAELSGLSLGYYSQFSLYTSDGGITSQIINFPNSIDPPNVSWTISGSFYQFTNTYSLVPPLPNFYAFDATSTNQTSASPYIMYFNEPVGKYKLQVDPLDGTEPANDVLWEIGYRNYL